MFKPGDILRHKNCLDIDIEIQSILFTACSYWAISVKYWNRHYNYYNHQDSEVVEIERSELSKWTLVRK